MNELPYTKFKNAFEKASENFEYGKYKFNTDSIFKKILKYIIKKWSCDERL